MKQIRTLAILSMLFVVGCASNPMRISETSTIEEPDAGKAQFVFMRSSFVGSAINASLFDITSGEPKFLGIISNKTKIEYQADPGSRTFMVVSEAADFMEAEVVPGTRYYAIVTPRMGVWKARFSLWPIKNKPDTRYHSGMEQFEKWKADTRLVEMTPEARAWYQANREDIKAKQDEYWPKWQQKSPEARQQRTLNADDGMNY